MLNIGKNYLPSHRLFFSHLFLGEDFRCYLFELCSNDNDCYGEYMVTHVYIIG